MWTWLKNFLSLNFNRTVTTWTECGYNMTGLRHIPLGYLSRLYAFCSLAVSLLVIEISLSSLTHQTYRYVTFSYRAIWNQRSTRANPDLKTIHKVIASIPGDMLEQAIKDRLQECRPRQEGHLMDITFCNNFTHIFKNFHWLHILSFISIQYL